jgi:pimeloyl-ACP methyl ester carboxylesterase
MFDVLARKPQRILAVPERTKLRELIWNDNETLLIVLSETSEAKVAAAVSHEYFRTIAHDVSGGNGRMLPTNNGSSPFANLIGVRMGRPDARRRHRRRSSDDSAGYRESKRICIVGASYGGYAALAGAAFTPDLYACAVSINGITDLPALMREQRARITGCRERIPEFSY